jgi:hypothetical protein
VQCHEKRRSEQVRVAHGDYAGVVF